MEDTYSYFLKHYFEVEKEKEKLLQKKKEIEKKMKYTKKSEAHNQLVKENLFLDYKLDQLDAKKNNFYEKYPNNKDIQ
ncbi:hypothetical protein SFC65_20320 [Priestia filamentosa]|uniref:hypothetical protein n=1 Tax=Priestia filamentosa TaxID=1402861 RepID=UPI003982A42A